MNHNLMNRAIILLSLFWCLMAQGQVLDVASIERVNIPKTEGTVMQSVAISPQGDYLLLSSDTRQGLFKWDLLSSSISTLTDDAGAGNEVLISNDGKQVVYGEVSYKGKRRHQAVKSIDLAKGKSQTLVKATRNLQGFSIQGNTVTTISDGKVNYRSLKKNEPTISRSVPVLSHHHLKLYITRDGVTTQLAPNGTDEHYIWASLSPNGERVLYYVSGHGAFVCDVDGSNVIPMGNLTAPKWWDENTIVGMNETDDEYSIIASSIVARTLDGSEQTLTGKDVIATYPLPCHTAGKIAFSTPDGEIYLITVK